VYECHLDQDRVSRHQQEQGQQIELIIQVCAGVSVSHDAAHIKMRPERKQLYTQPNSMFPNNVLCRWMVLNNLCYVFIYITIFYCVYCYIIYIIYFLLFFLLSLCF